jgi:hypothetical protein
MVNFLTARKWQTCVLCFSLNTLGSLPALAAEPQATDGQTSQKSSQSVLDEAQRHYQNGIELFKNSVYDAALVEFRRAFELAPSYKIQFNIGQVSRQLDDYASAVIAFEKYLKEGGQNVPAARYTEVKAELEKLRAWVGEVDVRSNAPNVTIAIDDITIGRTPIAAVLVNSGRRKITASMSGATTQTRIVDVAGGEKELVAFEFHTASTNVSPPSAEPAEGPKTEPTTSKNTESNGLIVSTAPTKTPAVETKSSTTPWYLWGSSAALALGAVGVGVFAVKTSNDLDRLKSDPVTSTNEYDDTHTRMMRLSVTSDILAGLALATGGIALYLTLSSPSHPESTSVSLIPSGVSLKQTF